MVKNGLIIAAALVFSLLEVTLSAAPLELGVPSSFRHDGQRRSLQSAQGFIRNTIASITWPDTQENALEVEIIYDLVITGGDLSSFAFGVFDEQFGTFVSGLSAEVDGVNSTFRVEKVNSLVSLRVQFPEPKSVDFTASMKFTVEGLICKRNNDEQAIVATWFNFISKVRTNEVEVDFRLPIGEFFDEDFNPSLTPDNGISTRVNDSNTITIFAPFTPDELKYGEADTTTVENIFLFLGQNVLPNDDVNDCVVLELLDIYTAFVVGVVVVLCVCVVGASLYQKFFESRVQTRRYRPRNRDLNIFPGNPDIILTPDGAANQTTVRAVIEEEDVTEFDEQVPVRTITVRPEAQRNANPDHVDGVSI